MNEFTELNLFNEYGKEITKEFEEINFKIQVGKRKDSDVFCEITIENNDWNIDTTGDFTDEQYSLIVKECESQIQKRKDYIKSYIDIEATEKWLLYN